MESMDESHKRIVENHAASGEKVREVRDSEGRLIAVTDRRVIKIEEGRKDNRDHRLIESILFTGPNVSGVTVEQLAGKQYDKLQIGIGLALVVIGLSFIVIGTAFAIPVAIIFGSIGLTLFLSGLLRADDNDIEVTIHRQNGEDTEIALSDSEAGIATAVSEAVASTHS